MLVECCFCNVPGKAAVLGLRTLVALDYCGAASSAELDLCPRRPFVIERLDSIRKKLECADLPKSQLRRWELEVDGPEEERDTDTTETDATIEGVPARALAASQEHVGEFQRHHPNDGIVLTIARVPNRDGDDA